MVYEVYKNLPTIIFITYNTFEKLKLNFCHSELFYVKTRVCLKYFVNDCRRATSDKELPNKTLKIASNLQYD